MTRLGLDQSNQSLTTLRGLADDTLSEEARF